MKQWPILHINNIFRSSKPMILKVFLSFKGCKVTIKVQTKYLSKTFESLLNLYKIKMFVERCASFHCYYEESFKGFPWTCGVWRHLGLRLFILVFTTYFDFETNVAIIFLHLFWERAIFDVVNFSSIMQTAKLSLLLDCFILIYSLSLLTKF
jgi:hypothetical protein